eukprot:403336935
MNANNVWTKILAFLVQMINYNQTPIIKLANFVRVASFLIKMDNAKNICFNQGECLLCRQDQFLNLTSLKCVDQCLPSQNALTITQHPLLNRPINYCRDSQIFIDGSSNLELELGTFYYPYKSIVPALIEQFNYVGQQSKSQELLFKETTVNYIDTLFVQQIILNNYNLTIRTILLREVFIHFYGKILKSLNPLNFLLQDSVIVTDWMNEGIILISDCSQTSANTFVGQLAITGNTFKGQRYLAVQLPHIQITTLNNVTIERNNFRIFATNDDANKQQLNVDSTALCNDMPADNLPRTISFTNNYVTSDAQIKQTAVQYNLYCIPKSDLNKRVQNCIFSNITAEHLRSSISVFTLNTGALTVTVRNITQNNVTVGPVQAFHLWFVGGITASIYLYDVKFYNCDTQSRIVICFVLQNYIWVENMIMINNTLDRSKNGFCFIKGAANPRTAVQYFSNLYFENNNIMQNQKMSSQTNYISNLKSQSFVIQNVTFDNIQYQDDMKYGSQLIRYDEYSMTPNPIENSTFSNITVKNCGVNFLLFGNFYNDGINDLKQLYALFMQKIIFIQNKFTKEAALIQIDAFVSTDNTQIILEDMLFHQNKFFAGGDLIIANQNQKNPMIIRNSNFCENYQGIIHLQAGDIERVDLPLQLLLTNLNYTRNYPMISAIIKLSTNSRINISDSYFYKTLSLSRGSAILADYQNVQVFIQNTTFLENYASSGGIFFSHYGGYVEIVNSKMIKNMAVAGSVGVVENQGSFSISNSFLSENHASRDTLISVLDSVDKISRINNCTMINNRRTSLQIMRNHIDEFNISSQDILNQIKRSRLYSPIEESLQNDLQYQFKISKTSFEIANSQFEQIQQVLN